MDVSVAMCTYNGSKYLRPQFESILKQTRPPDEIVVFDDNSTDGTRSILAEYAEEYPELVLLHRNEENIGPNQNFGKAIRTCSGDVIAISDQDDIWKENKLERQLNEFQRHDAALIFHNSRVTTESLEPITTLWETLSPDYRPNDNGPVEQFSDIVRRNFVQGASMLFDASLREYCLPIPDNWPYDYWIATVASYREGIYAIDERLISYRQHDEQVAGALKDGMVQQIKQNMNLRGERYRANVDQWKTLFDIIDKADNSEALVEKDTALQLVKHRLRFEKSRTRIYSCSPIIGAKYLLSNIYRSDYSTYGNGWKSVMKDLVQVVLGPAIKS